MNFCISLSRVKLEKDYMYDGVQLEYSLLDNSYKKSLYKSPLEPSKNI